MAVLSHRIVKSYRKNKGNDITDIHNFIKYKLWSMCSIDFEKRPPYVACLTLTVTNIAQEQKEWSPLV